MRLALAALGASLILTGCHNSGKEQACQQQYQTQYVLRGTPNDIGESAYVSQCLHDSGQ